MAENNDTFISFYLSSNTFRVSTRALRVLNAPVYVRFLINPDKNLMAMESYYRKEFTSFRIKRKVLLDSKYNSFRIISKKLCVLLARQMDWNPQKSYRIPGTIYPDRKVVIYQLEGAKEIPEKTAGNKH